MLMAEWPARSHGQFALGAVLTPLLLQGWVPPLATFWNTPAWTMCTEAFFYLIFPVGGALEAPEGLWPLLGLLLGLWLLGMVLPGLYMWLHPDGDLHPDAIPTVSGFGRSSSRRRRMFRRSCSGLRWPIWTG